MKDSVVQKNGKEFPVASEPVEDALLIASSSPLNPPQTVLVPPAPSYQLYPWEPANRLLAMIDERTHGRAGLLQRLFSYLFFGGLAALVNLGVFYVMYYHLLKTVDNTVLRNTLSYIVAAELSILANFIPNDRFTFNTLPGATRPWLQRCLRFHMTTIVGSVLTFMIELSLSTFGHIQPIASEAIATLIVLVYNFSFHHIFTYRHLKQAS